MKRLAFLLLLMSFMFTISAQSPDEAKGYYYYKNYAAAERLFHEYLQKQPLSAEAWLWLTKSYIQQGKQRRAADSLSLAPASLSDETYFLVAKGNLLLLNDRNDSALLFFERAIDKTRGRNTDVMNLVAAAQLDAESGDLRYALDLLQKALRKNKNNSLLYVTMGNIYLRMHNGTEAYKAYTQALEKDRNNAEAYFQLGQIFLSQKNPGMYLDLFEKAAAADRKYAPAYYELYRHYLYTEPAKAMTYFRQYASLSDSTTRQEYAYTDLLYLNRQYQEAIGHAQRLILAEGDSVQSRLYKLIAYSYSELKDTAAAILNMQRYFRTENDSNLIAKDYETMAELFATRPGMEDSVIFFYAGAINATTDPAARQKYYKELSQLANANKNYQAEAEWRGRYYLSNPDATNIDLFNWGIAAYRAKDYKAADSVFGRYVEKYPEQGFGYYWRARSNAAIDTGLTEGLAIPYYEKLVGVIAADTATTTNKKWLLDAYAYLAAWETNTEKDYEEAIGYLDKILEIDPENRSAKKYISILEQNMKNEPADNR